MKAQKKVLVFAILFFILILPSVIYFYVPKGYNNFIQLEIVGQEGHRISDFSFINQDEDIIVNDSLRGYIYVANFFFTSCPTICPVMTYNMRHLQQELKVYPNIKFFGSPSSYLIYLFVEPDTRFCLCKPTVSCTAEDTS